jgi:acyl carrier protein
MVPHTGIMNILMQQIEWFELNHNSKSFFYLSTNFDASISDIGTTFLAGATLCMERGDQIEIAKNLPAILQKNAITHVDLPPSLLPLLKANDMPSTLQTIVIGGEVCDPSTIQEWAGAYRLFNVYGPTETTICTSMKRCEPDWNEAIIGKPIKQIGYAILDEELKAVSEGSKGELYISGVSLALGYVNNADLTGQRFVTIEGQRFYKTGDLVKQNSKGEFVYLGRTDRQCKINGQLVAPEEVEAAISKHPNVKRATVISIAGQLSAAIEGINLTQKVLRYYLKQHLPSWMIPSHYVFLDKLPTNDNGKIDFNAINRLPKTMDSKYSTNISEICLHMQTLQKVWQGVLKLNSPPATNKDFFDDLGGDSLNALEMILASETEGLFFPTGILAELRTIQDLASWLQNSSTQVANDGLLASYLKEDIVAEGAASNLPNSSGKRILLTGATGFLGIHVLLELLRSTTVRSSA